MIPDWGVRSQLTDGELEELASRCCPECGELLLVGQWPFCKPGRGHDPFVASHLAVVQDSIPGGLVIENMSSTPITVYSKSDYKREMKARGLVNKVEHVGVPGTDKSPHTTRWAAPPPWIDPEFEAARIQAWHQWDIDHGLITG